MIWFWRFGRYWMDNKDLEALDLFRGLNDGWVRYLDLGINVRVLLWF
jgi:hypothetical protein